MNITNRGVFGIFRNQNIGFKYIYVQVQRAPGHLHTTRQVSNGNYSVANLL